MANTDFKHIKLIEYGTSLQKGKPFAIKPQFFSGDNGIEAQRREDGVDWRMMKGIIHNVDNWAGKIIFQYDGGNYYAYTQSVLQLSMAKEHFLNIFGSFQRIITIEPSQEAMRALTEVLKVVYAENKRIHIGPMWIPQNECPGIVSIYCDNIHVGCMDEDGNFMKIRLSPENNYALFFRGIKSLREPVKKENYKAIVDEICGAWPHGNNLVKNEFIGHRDKYKGVVANIKHYAKGFAMAKKALKVSEDFKRTCPPPLQYYLDRAMVDCKNVVAEVKNQSENLGYYRDKFLESDANVKHLEQCIKDSGKDWGQVNNLLKAGVIEKLEYDNRKGLVWTYAPGTYNYTTARLGASGTCFLGRVQVTLRNRGAERMFDFKAISYNQNITPGTWHWYPGNYCLGSYQNIMEILVAKRQISQLILVTREYVYSKNENSPLRREFAHFAHMNLENPEVIDDSFEVWKAKQQQKV